MRQTFAFFLVGPDGARRLMPALCQDLPDALQCARALLEAHKDVDSIELEWGANIHVVQRPRLSGAGAGEQTLI